MLNTFITLFENDHIKCGKKQIRALSPLWWLIKMGQLLGVCVCVVMFYLALNVLFMW